MTADFSKSLFSLICNAIIVVWTAISVYRGYCPRGEDGKRHRSAKTFRYFTTDSNILAALSALALIPFGVIGVTGGGFALPVWAVALKYAGTAAVTVTFLTVMLFLGPTQGYRDMLAGDGLYMHLIGPVLAVVSFCVPEAGVPIGWPQTLLGLLPTLLYGGIYWLQVVARGEDNGGWPDFYGFNRNGKWRWSIAVMVSCAYLVAIGLMLLHNLPG